MKGEVLKHDPELFRDELLAYKGSYFDFFMEKGKLLSKSERRKLREWLKSQRPPQPPFLELYHKDVRDYRDVLLPESVDWVITDPPYSKKFLWVYEVLGELSAYVLKPGGGLLVMVGQSYLPEIIGKLSSKLNYVWTLAYLTPGGQSPYLWRIRCNSFWKPVLLFSKGKYSGDSFGDVVKTSPNNNDKRFHRWGQSEEGFELLFDKFVFPGQTILDPFVGGGTTAVVALKRGCNFIGIDNDLESLLTTKKRCQAFGLDFILKGHV